VLVEGGIATVLIGAVFRTRLARETPPSIEAHAADLGRALFTDYLLPFEMLSVLLLTAMVGVVLLSKKELK
jgi:NADH-quinone oxidoreductase subunit J